MAKLFKIFRSYYDLDYERKMVVGIVISMYICFKVADHFGSQMKTH